MFSTLALLGAGIASIGGALGLLVGVLLTGGTKAAYGGDGSCATNDCANQ
jgi:hypothetical protein